MKLPVQAQPVLRNVSDTKIAMTNAVIASGCSTWKKIGCAGAVAACAAVCYASGGLACAGCFAGLGQSSCIDCL
ncbi:hypothetical protein [Pseudanabaena sp. PCC 6802]|uniref:hypothetical protein n=1 Tax=Pseudanabaena sp. PCC 6802 TaxID=118173 RepID=UPI00037AC17D|nr:hypothetical protein [Pseudanabaena sp. PCC 6802]